MATELTENKAGKEGPSQNGRQGVYDIVFSPQVACLAAVALTLSFILPTDGLGLSLCWFKSCFELPCPGCGLTRSVTCISQLQFAKAWDYHPFGTLIYALIIANVVLLIVPKAKRGALRSKISRIDRWLQPIWMAIVVSFVIFGWSRILLGNSSI